MKSRVVFLLLSLYFIVLVPVFAESPDREDSLPIYLTDEELQRLDEIGIRHRSTSAPVGEIRNSAEWEPSVGVIIRWPLGIPISLIAEMSEDLIVTTIVGTQQQQSNAQSSYTSGGVNMSNTEFIIAPTDSYWTRDYGPWFIFVDNEMAIVDQVYNRPRPNDDVIPQAIGTEWGLTVYGMDLIHTGGNHMSEGLGMSMSTRLVYDENDDDLTASEVDAMMLAYLGNDYTVLEYIESGGIHHIDCWAKFLNPTTILVKDVPPGHPSYDLLNARALFLSQQTSAWDQPYTVLRIFCPSGTAYTNSIILRDKVFVPLFNSSYDSVALQVYEDAMPGYEILGFLGSWLDDDAIHCRTMGVPDAGMLFIDHVPLTDDDVSAGDYPILTTIKACSGQPLLSDSLRVHYSVNGGSWQYVTMQSTKLQDEYIGYIPSQVGGSEISYYVEAADESGRVETHPYIGAPWAHKFIAPPQVPTLDEWGIFLTLALLTVAIIKKRKSAQS
ncbi:agmatine deiminase family protein [candidate division CSSED10-310 bacterium]|uniref:Agmatine deiminase family protein n=1 Tax=candidate division CSSED10-310 bacterium TaxID=2855610 RepID=A0ABV6Z0J9_UNCC1